MELKEDSVRGNIIVKGTDEAELTGIVAMYEAHDEKTLQKNASGEEIEMGALVNWTRHLAGHRAFFWVRNTELIIFATGRCPYYVRLG